MPLPLLPGRVVLLPMPLPVPVPLKPPVDPVPVPRLPEPPVPVPVPVPLLEPEPVPTPELLDEPPLPPPEEPVVPPPVEPTPPLPLVLPCGLLADVSLLERRELLRCWLDVADCPPLRWPLALMPLPVPPVLPALPEPLVPAPPVDELLAEEPEEPEEPDDCAWTNAAPAAIRAARDRVMMGDCFMMSPSAC